MTFLILFLLFTVVPAVELWTLIEIGRVVGGFETMLYVVAIGILGAWLGKRAGVSVLRELFEALREQKAPADKLVEGALVLVGSVLLVTPGVLTDVTGILLFIPPLRRWLAPKVKRAALAWATRRGVQVGTAGPGPRARQRHEAEKKVFTHPKV
ncbi:MAG: FxsA family protein [Pseudomonadota bacterium]|nr:FxsA family protein [Pseudomonadota bacterium]